MSVAAGSDPFTNALMRAKEIAANIKKPGGRDEEDDYEDNYDNRKRPLNGAGNVQNNYPPEGQPQSKRPMMDGGGGYMNQAMDQALKDEIRVPSSCVKFLIGENGETLSKLQATSHCNIQIPPPGPDPHAERPIILSGTKQCIEQCKEQIRDVLQKNAGPPGQMPMGGMGRMPGGYGQGGQGMPPPMPIETVDMLIPQNKVGLIIGKGGETIKDLQVQSGCRMNMVQDGMYQNAPEKPLRMSGDTAAIQKARELVSGLLQQDFGGRGNNNQNNNNNNNNNNFRPNNGPFECTKNMAVPKEYVGVVIGRSGDTIRRLQEETGCKVQFNTVDQGQPGDRWLIMQGSQDACEKCENNVKEMLGKVMQKDAKFGGPNTQTCEYQVPANKCGLVIGKGGESIRQMKEQSGAHIEMNKHSPHDAPTKAFTIRGTSQQIEAAQQLIAQRIGEPDGAGYPSGGPHHHSPGGMGGMQVRGGMQHPGQRMPGHGNPMMAPQAADPAALAYQQQQQAQMAYYQAYYQQQAHIAQMQGAQMQGAQMQGAQMQGAQMQAAQMQGGHPAQMQGATPTPNPASAAPSTSNSEQSSQSVQQQWAAYYQQLVQMYGEQQAQTYWTQLSQQQNASSQQQGATQPPQ